MWAETGCRNHAAEITGIIKPEEQKQEWRVVKMIRILAIGNSFSEDATYYLHQILEAAGVENLVVNLFIGGCPLEKHWLNIERKAREYQMQVNGVKTDRHVSVQDMLQEAEWDFIVTQQASHDSGWLDTYEPFLGNMVNYLKENAGDAKLLLHETWAYEKDSTHWNFGRYNKDQQEMYCRLRLAYTTMAEKHGLVLIPGGDLIQRLRGTAFFGDSAGRTICRDGFHMNYMYGRYAIGCIWARCLTGIGVKGNSFLPETVYMPYEKPDREIIAVIQSLADDVEVRDCARKV